MKLRCFGNYRLKLDTTPVQCTGIDPRTTRALGAKEKPKDTSLVTVWVRIRTAPAHWEMEKTPEVAFLEIVGVRTRTSLAHRELENNPSALHE